MMSPFSYDYQIWEEPQLKATIPTKVSFFLLVVIYFKEGVYSQCYCFELGVFKVSVVKVMLQVEELAITADTLKLKDDCIHLLSQF